jgi:excisionase family DNA binding protein
VTPGPPRGPGLDDLAADPSRAADLAPEVARALILRAAAVVAALATSPSAGPPAPVPEDRLLSVDEAARLLGVSPDWLYRRAHRLPFTVRMGRVVRFSATGLARYIQQRQAR